MPHTFALLSFMTLVLQLVAYFAKELAIQDD